MLFRSVVLTGRLQWAQIEQVLAPHFARKAAPASTGIAQDMLGGAIKPGTEAAGKGFTMIAGSGNIEVQAQADQMQIAAKLDVSIQSQSAHIDWAAAKKITLSTAAGANITIKGGNITVQCPGTIAIHAATKSFVGPERSEEHTSELQSL